MKTIRYLNGKKTSRRYRNSEAQALLEAAAIMVAIVFLFLALIDGCIFVWGLELSYEACSIACRAASMGPPEALQSGAPKRNAESALGSLAQREGPVTVVPACIVSECVRKPLPVSPFGGAVDGDVSVATTVKVFLPFTCSLLRCGPVSISHTQRYPYSWSLAPHVTTR